MMFNLILMHCMCIIYQELAGAQARKRIKQKTKILIIKIRKIEYTSNITSLLHRGPLLAPPMLLTLVSPCKHVNPLAIRLKPCPTTCYIHLPKYNNISSFTFLSTPCLRCYRTIYMMC